MAAVVARETRGTLVGLRGSHAVTRSLRHRDEASAARGRPLPISDRAVDLYLERQRIPGRCRCRGGDRGYLGNCAWCKEFRRVDLLLRNELMFETWALYFLSDTNPFEPGEDDHRRWQQEFEWHLERRGLRDRLEARARSRRKAAAK